MTPGTKPRRIALLFEYATLNGGERSMLACLDWMKQHDTRFEFVAIAPGTGYLADALLERGIRVIPWQTGSAHSAVPSREGAELRLQDAVRDADPALLHANSLAMGRLTGRVAGRLSIPTSSHLRDILKLSSAATADLNRNQRLIAVSQATRDFHTARGMDVHRVVVIRNGLNLVQFQPRPARGWLRRELGLPEGVVLLATIGQIGLRKGQNILAAAAPEIVSSIPDAHFLMIGERSSIKAESIEYEESIRHSFDAHDLSSHLHCLGRRDDIPNLLTEIDLIVHPANQEPFGRVLLEAAACGIPVVATDVGGTSEIVVDGVTGRLVPPQNPHALAAAVTGLLVNVPLLKSMGIAARHRALTEFDVARSAESLLQEWDRLTPN